MSRLGDAKILGGIGSILLLIPGVSIVGYILILIAGKYVSDELGDRSIFDNMLYAVIAGIIGVAAAAFIIFTGAVFSFYTFTMSAFTGLIAGLVVAWIGLIVSSVFLRRAYDTMATKLNVGMFRTAGMLYFIGGHPDDSPGGVPHPVRSGDRADSGFLLYPRGPTRGAAAHGDGGPSAGDEVLPQLRRPAGVFGDLLRKVRSKAAVKIVCYFALAPSSM